VNHHQISQAAAQLLALVCAAFWSSVILTAAMAPLAVA
jgi:hypothetical protein